MSWLRRGRTVHGLERAASIPALAGLAIAAIALSGSTPIAAAASAQRAPPVQNLDRCVPGPQCDYGAAYESFRTWGNVAPHPRGDCTFAAAADWEQIVLGVHAQPATIDREFAQAGGSRQIGLPQSALWSYWQREGIAGVRLTALHAYTTDRTDVQNAVRDYRAMIAELTFTSDHRFAQYVISAKLHDVVVDGFTPRGPLAVSWGHTLQMTWGQWHAEVVGMWAIEAT